MNYLLIIGEQKFVSFCYF